MYDLRILNGKVYKDQSYHDVNIYVQDGVIKKLSKEQLDAKETYDASNQIIYPGIIDPHTHFDLDLGDIRSKDDFYYGTKAALFGGVTTIIDFLSPVDNAEDLEKEFKKRRKEAKKSLTDYKFHACVKDPKNEVLNITSKMKELGLNTVKLFTTYSDSLRRTYDQEIRELLTLSSNGDFLVTAHIENDEMINNLDGLTFMDLAESRPQESETTEALKLAQMVKETKGNLYMVHLSSGNTLKALKERFSDILNDKFIVESCPHYFVFNNDVFKESNGYLYTMAPPLRDEMDRLLLHKMIDDVYTIGTDHCSFDSTDKSRTLLSELPLGIGGVEYSFDVMYSMFGDKIVDKMTINVAKAHKLYPQKGIIKEGSDADFFMYQLGDRILFENHSNTDYFVYKNLEVKGKVVSTLIKGEFALKDGVVYERVGELLNKVVNR